MAFLATIFTNRMSTKQNYMPISFPSFTRIGQQMLKLEVQGFHLVPVIYDFRSADFWGLYSLMYNGLKGLLP
jgi:hypothetical protein